MAVQLSQASQEKIQHLLERYPTRHAVLLPALPEFKRRHPQLTLRIEATHQYADFTGSRVDVAIRAGVQDSNLPSGWR